MQGSGFQPPPRRAFLSLHLSRQIRLFKYLRRIFRRVWRPLFAVWNFKFPSSRPGVCLNILSNRSQRTSFSSSCHSSCCDNFTKGQFGRLSHFYELFFLLAIESLRKTFSLSDESDLRPESEKLFRSLLAFFLRSSSSLLRLVFLFSGRGGLEN